MYKDKYKKAILQNSDSKSAVNCVTWGLRIAVFILWGCGDMVCRGTASEAGLQKWSSVLGTVPAPDTSIMNKRDSNKEKERQSDDKRTSA